MKKKILSVFLSFCMIISCMVGISLTASAATTLTNTTTTWSGEYTVSSDVMISSNVTVTADTTLTIAEGVTVTVNKGINAEGKTLTVAGKGTLVVNGANGADGAVGANANDNNGGNAENGGNGSNGANGITGNVIVNGATVTVTGGDGGTGGNGGNSDGGVGGSGGNGGNGGNGIFGNVIVNGATVTVTGGYGGYGGNGGNGGNGGSAGSGGHGIYGNLTVNSGTVTVKGGDGGDGGLGGSVETFGSPGNSGSAVSGTITGSAQESDDNNTWSAVSGTTSTKQYVKITPHTHGFTYSLSKTTSDNDTLVATCSGECCDLTGKMALLTIVKPLHEKYGDDKEAAANVTGDTKVLGTPTVSYQKKTGNTTWGTATTTAPTDAGTYKASITLGTGTGAKTAFVEYTIAKAAGPAAPESVSATHTDTTVTVTAPAQTDPATYEYSINSIDWQTGTEFTNLSPNTSYTIRARVAATDNVEAGNEKTQTVLTNLAVTINGTPLNGKTLTVSVLPANLTDLTYAWYYGADGTEALENTSGSYTLTDADVGKQLKVVVNTQNLINSGSAVSETISDIVTYTVKFDGNGGSGEMPTDVKVTEGTTYTFPACGFTAPDGKKFGYWELSGSAVGYDVGATETITSANADTNGVVTVTAFYFTPLEIKAGEEKTVVLGSKITSVESNKTSIASVTKDGNTFKVKGVAAGTTYIVVKYGTNSSETYEVTVKSKAKPTPSPTPSDTTTTTTANEPKIEGGNGASGWNNITSEISKTKEGGSVTVDMSGATTVPAAVLEAVKGKDVDVVLDMGDGVTWTINGNDISSVSGAIDLGVKLGSSGIPAEVTNNVTGEKYSTTLHLNHNGNFGFKAVMTVPLRKQDAGLFANLFYYNPNRKALEFVSSAQIDENGNAELDFNHASDYAIVIDNHPLDMQMIKASADGNSVKLSWDAVSGATSYTVYTAKDGKWSKLATTKKTTIDVLKLKNNKTYKFLVRAKVNGKLTPVKESYKITIKVCYKPVLTAKAKNGAVTLKWSEVNNATKYRVVKSVNGEWKKVKTTSKTSLKISDVKSGNKYKYAVQAYVNGKWTTIGKASTATVKAK